MKKKSKGFTLVELIVVIAVLVILAAILIPTMTGVIEDAKQATADANARTVYTAATAYVAKEYPTTHADATIASTVLADYLGSTFTGTYSAATNSSGEVVSATWSDGTTTGTYPTT